MNANNPQDLEKLIHCTLRSLPDRRAPATLEHRVLAAIDKETKGGCLWLPKAPEDTPAA